MTSRISSWARLSLASLRHFGTRPEPKSTGSTLILKWRQPPGFASRVQRSGSMLVTRHFPERRVRAPFRVVVTRRSEEHKSELQSLTRISYAVLCLKKKITHITLTYHNTIQSLISQY